MKYTDDKYIISNIELSLINTEIILKSIDYNLNNILKITNTIQTIKDDKKAMVCLLKIKDISMESIVEKCNMLKAALDRYMIPYEDIIVPESKTYIALRSIPKELIPRPEIHKRFREKISKNNLPPDLSSISIDGGDDCD